MTQSHCATSTRTIQLRFRVWLLLMIVMLGVFALRVLPTLKIETDILALLPSEHSDAATSHAVDKFSQALTSKLIILVGAPNAPQAKQAAQAYAQALRDSKAFAQVNLEQDGLTEALLESYREHRGYLLSQRQLALLQAGKQTQLQNDALRAAFTPTGLMRVMSFADDPLGLGNDYLMQQLPHIGAAQLDGKVLVVTDQSLHSEAHSYVLLTTELSGSPFATQVQEDATTALTSARTAAQQVIAPAQLDVVISGAMPHAKAARERATNELSIFGTLEIILVMLLLMVVFSKRRPLALSVITIALVVVAVGLSFLGTVQAILAMMALSVIAWVLARPLALGAITMGLASVAGLCATHFVFGAVHVLALVFGSSLIGGVIDYSIHFFADRFRGDPDWTPASAVDHVGGAILLGLCTTLLGYVVLLLVPFPGLRQIALFCVAGLAIGCTTVLCAYPVLYKVPAQSDAWGPRIGEWLAQCFKPGLWTAPRAAIFIALLLSALFGLHRVVLQDDVRALQSSPPELIAAERRAAALLQSGIESRYFLVQGATAQAVLQTETSLTQRLDALQAAGKLQAYTAVTRALPPLVQQQAAHDVLNQHVLNEQGVLPSLLRQLGFNAADIATRVAAFNASQPLLPEDWWASLASRPYRDLWLGELSQQSGGQSERQSKEQSTSRFASIVSLAGVRDVPALREAAQQVSGVRLIDRVQSVTDVLRSYRQAMSWLLCVVYVVAMLMLSFQYGWREAPLLLVPSALASGVTLGLFGWFGVPVNLFTLLALWLVLGLGVDYGIFLRHGRTELPTAVLSVSLSAITTLLAFGMLAFSATPFIRSIGLTLLFAISLSWLFAMLSCLTVNSGFSNAAVAEHS